MLTFDKLKIVVSASDCIDNINLNKFSTISKNGVVTEYKYQQVSPYQLYIEKDVTDNEVIIEFTGKILGARYSELINQTNIRQCLQNLNALELCNLDIDTILNEGKVVKADVTIDTEYPDITSLTKELQSCIKNNERYTAVNKRGNFIVEKNVKTKNRKLRLTIYDKEQEMSLQDNQRWLQTLNEAEAKTLNDYFKNKIRFELNVNSIKAIKDWLCISDNSLSSVLHAEANPIMTFLDSILVDNAEAHIVHSLRDAERMALMKANDFDMKAIENVVKLHKAQSTKLSDMMKPYRKLYKALNENEATGIKERLKDILLEIFLIGFFVSF